jgi:hypothetical protein
VLIQYLHEARHVRAFKIVWQVHVHIESGDGVLHAHALVFNDNGMADAFDANFIDCQVAGVRAALYVCDGCCGIHFVPSELSVGRIITIAPLFYSS